MQKILRVLAASPICIAILGGLISLAAYLSDMGGHVPMGAVFGILTAILSGALSVIGMSAFLKLKDKNTTDKAIVILNAMLLSAACLLWLYDKLN